MLIQSKQSNVFQIIITKNNRVITNKTKKYTKDGHCEFSERTIEGMKQDVMPLMMETLEEHKKIFLNVKDIDVRDVVVIRFIQRLALSAFDDVGRVLPFFKLCWM